MFTSVCVIALCITQAERIDAGSLGTSERVIRTFEYPIVDAFLKVTFSPDDSKLFVRTWDRMPGILWDLDSGRRVLRLDGNYQWANTLGSAAFSRDGRILDVPDHRFLSIQLPVANGVLRRADQYGGEIRRWDTTTGGTLESLLLPEGHSSAALTVLADGRLVSHEWHTDPVTLQQVGATGVWDPVSGRRRELAANRNLEVLFCKSRGLLITSLHIPP